MDAATKILSDQDKMQRKSDGDASNGSSVSYFSLPARGKKTQKDDTAGEDEEIALFLQLINTYDDNDESNGRRTGLCCPDEITRASSRGVVDPSSSSYRWWLSLVGLCILYNVIFIIARSVFWKLQSAGFIAWLILDYLCDAFYLIDMIVQSRTAYLKGGSIVTGRRKMARNYICSHIFVFDVLSLLPTDLFYLVIGMNMPVVRLNRILKLGRLFKLIHRIESWARHPNVLRAASLATFMVIIIHWNACFYFQISAWIGFGSDDWVYPSINETLYPTNASLARMYVYCFYWSTIVLTTIGEGNAPVTNVEYIYMTVNFIIAISLFATIVGNVGSIINNMTARKAEFHEKLDSVKRSMTFRRAGKKLQRRVIEWFVYVWDQEHSFENDPDCNALPKKLQLDLAMDEHVETLARIEIFRDCEPGLLEEIVQRFTPAVYNPGDFLCKRGEIGRELFIVSQGRLAIMGETEDCVTDVLEEGHVFGEISILNIPENRKGNRRICSVRSIGFSHVFILSKKDFSEVIELYPDAEMKLMEKSRQMLRQYGLFDRRLSTNFMFSELNNVIPATDKIKTLQNDIQSLQNTLQSVLDSINNKSNRGSGQNDSSRTSSFSTEDVASNSTSDSKTDNLPSHHNKNFKS